MLKRLIVGIAVGTVSGLVVKNKKKKENVYTIDNYINDMQNQTESLNKTLDMISEEDEMIKEYFEKLNNEIDKMIEEKKKEEQDYFNNPKDYIDNAIKELQELKDNLELFEEEFPEEYNDIFGNSIEDYSEYDNVVSLSNYKTNRV
jgi:chromosome segregation ATPase